MDKKIYCIAKFCFISIVMAFILSGLLAACSLEGDIEALRKKFVEDPEPSLPTSVIPSAPATAPTVIAADGQLTVSWTVVEGATIYEVWLGTANNSNTATKQGGDVLGLSVVITGLTNNTTYYIWIKAKNSVGTSGFSPVASGTPFISVSTPQAPSTPSVSIGNEQITITWAAVQGATAYEIWLSTVNNSTTATKRGSDVFGTSVTLTSLANGTTYYIWVKAKNSVGTSGFSPAASGVPNVTPGLYRNNAKIGNQNLSNSLSYISTYAVSGDDYYIVLGANESISPMNLNYSGKTVGITLIGYNSERAITLASNGSMFTINNGVTLTLDENITLVGLSTNTAALVQINSGNLIINDGAKISGNTSISNGSSGIGGLGGGIYVDGGTVTMNSGVISGNTLRPGNGSGNRNSYGGGVYIGRGTFTMNGGTINGNTTQGYSGITNYGIGGGGGIYVTSDGTFIMHGGTISGNTASMVNNTNPSTSLITGSACGGGIYVANGGTITMTGGTISGNTASGDTVYGRSSGQGGGVFVIGGTFTMYSGSIIENTADSGGGILVTHGGIVTMNGGTISRNTSTGTGTGTFLSSGGGIYVYGGTVTMYGGTISGNTAYRGGGIYIYTSAYYSVYSIYKKLPPSGSGQSSGIIYGNEETGVDEEGTPLKNTASSDGHAVYFIYETAGSTSLNSDSSMRNTTAGQTDYIDTETGRGLSANGNPPYGQ